MTYDPTPPSPQALPPKAPDNTVALVVYILYFVAYFVGGITSIVGVVMAHLQVGSAPPLLQTHYRFQIRTFWIGVLYLVVGILLTIVIVGIAVLLWWFVWSLVRNIKGVIALSENRPIDNPASWLFG